MILPLGLLWAPSLNAEGEFKPDGAGLATTNTPVCTARNPTQTRKEEDLTAKSKKSKKFCES
jgi:hypothetical protein